MNEPLSKPIEQSLRRCRRLRRLLMAIRAAGAASSAALLWLLAACAVDLALDLSWGWRLAALLIGCAATGAVLARGLWQALRRISPLRVAAQLEAAHPDLQQRLATLVGQHLTPPGLRGSPAMLARIEAEAALMLCGAPLLPWPVWRSTIMPWLIAAAAGCVLAALWTTSAVPMGHLAARALRPWSQSLSATAARLQVTPGSVTLRADEALEVRVSVSGHGAAAVQLHTSHDGRTWSRLAMLPVGEAVYAYTLWPIERDIRYFVSAGNARSAEYLARIMRPPAVAEYRIQYRYPLYTGRGSITVRNTDGIIEALVGTTVSLALVATEPLEGAELRIDGRQIPLRRGSQANVMEAELRIEASARGDLSLLSSDGLRGELPGALTIRAQEDRQPLVRLLRPPADLRLHPSQPLPLAYQAIDDFGITALEVVVRVNSGPTLSLPIQRRGDVRLQEGQVLLDLATLGLKMGDVLSIALAAEDGTSRRVISEPRQIVLTPASIDANSHLRIGELRKALALIGELTRELSTTAELLERAPGQGAAEEQAAIARTQAGQRTGAAAEWGLLLHQALLRVVARSPSPQHTSLLARCVDQARVLVWQSGQLAAMDWHVADLPRLRAQVSDAARQAVELEQTLRVLRSAELAASILADYASLGSDLPAPATQPVDHRLAQARERIRQAMLAALRELGVDPASPTLQHDLESMIRTLNDMASAAAPIAFGPAAQAWGQALIAGSELPPLAQRLVSASLVEALRPDTLPLAAEDLRLASRVVMATAAASLADVQVRNQVLAELPATLAALQREHATMRLGGADAAAPEVHSQGADARMRLRRWLSALGEGASTEAEDLALEASAHIARRQYDAAEEADRQLVQTLRWRGQEPADAEALGQTLESLRALDRLSAEQRELAQRTASRPRWEETLRLADEQDRVAQQIGGMDRQEQAATRLNPPSYELRREAAAAVQRAQEQLAILPQKLTDAQDRAEAYLRAAALAEELREAAEAASPAQWHGIEQAAEQARIALDDAERALETSSAAVGPAAAEQLASALRDYGDLIVDADAVLRARLAPALFQLQQALRPPLRTTAIERAAAQARSAIELAQNRLGEAQARLIENEPLVAARWYAEAASAALAQQPPDLSTAQSSQHGAALALGRAWEDILRRAARQRLGITPGFRSLIWPDEGNLDDQGDSPGRLLPGLREWGFLGPRRSDAIAAPMRESDPPAYQESLRLYFEALGRARQPERNDP